MDFTELQDDPFPFFKTGFVRIPIGLVNAIKLKEQYYWLVNLIVPFIIRMVFTMITE